MWHILVAAIGAQNHKTRQEVGKRRTEDVKRNVEFSEGQQRGCVVHPSGSKRGGAGDAQRGQRSMEFSEG